MVISEVIGRFRRFGRHTVDRNAPTRRRRRPERWRTRSLVLEPLEPRVLLNADVVISEILASNQNGLRDNDGDTPDWLEIHNRSQSSVDLQGWHLTDDAQNLTQWQFPVSTVLAADSRLVVFASSKDTVASNGELHTNFGPGSNGEFLALVDSAGTVVHGFEPSCPSQARRFS